MRFRESLTFFVALSLGTGVSLAADFDLDGVADAIDNAPSHYNPSQSNLDGDAFGDAMDTDLDGDGFLNSLTSSILADNAPEHFNSDQSDADGDGMGDVAETAYGRNPLNPSDANLAGMRSIIAPLTSYNPGTQPGLLVNISGSGYFFGGDEQRGDYFNISFDLNNDNVFGDATGFGVGPSGDKFFLSPAALQAAGIDQVGDHTIGFWASLAGAASGPVSATIQTVPEPASLGLFGIAVLALGRRRRNRF